MGVQVILLGLLVVIILFAFAYLMLVKWEVSTRQAPKPPHATETPAPHGAGVSASTNSPPHVQWWRRVWIMSSMGSTLRVAIILALIAGLIVGVKYMDVTTWFTTFTQRIPIPFTVIIAALFLLIIAVTESYKSGGVEAKWITRLLVGGLVVYVILFFTFGEKVNDVIGTFQKYNSEAVFNPQPTQQKEVGRTYSSPESLVVTKTNWTEVSQKGGLCIRTWIADGLPPFLDILYFEENIKSFRWKLKENFNGDEIEVHYQFRSPGQCSM